MKKVFSLLTVLLLGLILVACGGSEERPNVELKTSFADGNAQRRFTYEQSSPLEMPDGRIITAGDLKPTWQYVEQQLNITIDDVSTPGQTPRDMFDLAGATQYTSAHIYGGGNLGESIMNAGTQEYFVPLNEHMDKLPNFKSYLESNPLVSDSITAFDGNIYHVPYIAEVGSYARMYMGRYSWVTALLDGEVGGVSFEHEVETKTLTPSYEPYWKDGVEGALPYGGLRKETNVIELQNAAAVAGVLTGSAALDVLLAYIDDQYDLEKPSDLFLGATAQYDIDELTALWRVISLYPNTLSKEATGAVVADATIYPFFTRQSNHREELLRLQVYFGGQRVHGSDSYGSRFYIDEEGELQYSYAEESFINNLSRMRGWASENLIDERVFGPANSTNNRTGLIFSDSVPTNRVFGFMTYDFTASTTAETGGQDDVIAILPPLTTTPVSDGDFVHYVENSRVVKPDGWGIAAHTTGDQLDAALELFDYFFTEEGSKIQNYGTPDMWEEDETFINPFDGVEGPLFNEWARTTAAAVANADMSSFLRDHIGSLIAIGYQKEIGFEIQSTSENGFTSWALYTEANGGTGVIMNSYTATEPYYQLAPAIISLTLNEQQLIADQTTMRADTQIVDFMFGYIGGIDAEGVPKTVAEVQAMFDEARADVFLQVYQDAFNRLRS